MASRVFVDGAGTEWTVWDVVPGLNHPKSLHVSTLPEELSGGWLCFANGDAVKRRLYPIPAAWAELPDATLDLLCRAAVPVVRRGEPAAAEPPPVPIP